MEGRAGSLIARAVALAAVAGGFALPAGAAGADDVKRVAKVAPGVYLGKVSAEAADDVSPEPGSEPAEVIEAKEGSASAKIVGGSTTTIEEWPWQAAILFDQTIVPGDGFDRQFCGGTLVAPRIVISAAHCFFDATAAPGDDNDNDFDDIFFDVVTGRTTLSTAEGQEIDPVAYFPFLDAGGDPLFDGDVGNGWDAVFIQLAEPSTSQTIKIAGPNEGAVWAPGRTAFATGWGELADGSGFFPDDLQEVQIGMVSDDICGSDPVYGASGLFLPETMVCAGVLAGGKDSCRGDSGGPLVVPIAGGGFRLVGDTSFGIGCALPNKPGIYGRIADDPMRSGLASGIKIVAGVDVLGSGAQPPAPPTPPTPPPPPGPSAECLDAQAKLDKAKKKLKKAKKKLKGAKKAGEPTKGKKRKVKKAKRKKKKAKKAVKELC